MKISFRLDQYFICLSFLNLLYVECSVADPHTKNANADADPGKNLDADADSCPY
jgi:hypothetical protein